MQLKESYLTFLEFQNEMNASYSNFDVNVLVSEITISNKHNKVIGYEGSNLLPSLKYSFKRFLFSSKIRSAKILFFVNSENQYHVQFNIAKGLIKENYACLFLTTKDNLYRKIKNDGFHVSYIMGVNAFKPQFRIENNCQKFQLAYQVLRNYYPYINYFSSYYQKILQHYKPKYVVVGNDITFQGRLLAKICQNWKIKVGVIQHGALDGSSPLNKETIADHLYVYGEKVKQELIDLGVSKERILVSGSPAIHNIGLSDDNNEFIKSLKPYFLIGISGVGILTSKKNHEEIISCIYKLTNKYSNYNWVFKLHPKDQISNYKNAPKNVIILTNQDLKKLKLNNSTLISHSIGVISGGSTFALDSLLLSKQVVTLDFHGELNEVPFIKDGLTFHSTSKNQFEMNIQRLLNGETVSNIKSKMEQYYFKYNDMGYKAGKFITENIKLCVESQEL